MANRFSVNPLGGFSVGGALASLGDTFKENRLMGQQEEKQAQLEQLRQRAFSGDPQAIQELSALDPNAAMQFQQGAQGRELKKYNALQKRTAEYIAKASALPEEERQAYFESGIDNPNLDIDEDDRAYFSDPNLAKAVVGQVLGQDYAESVYGKTADVKTKTIETPTGTKIIDEATGETIKDIVIPERKAEFESLQSERKRKTAEAVAKEKSRIAKEKIEATDRKEATKASIETSANTFKLANELLKGDQIEDITGKFDRLGTMVGLQGGNEADVMNKANQLKDLLTLDNLKLMSGVLTDRDIKVLASAASGLNLDEYGFVGSTEGVKNQIRKIMSSLDQKLKAAVKRGDLSQLDYDNIKNPKEDELTDEDLLSKYGD